MARAFLFILVKLPIFFPTTHTESLDIFLIFHQNDGHIGISAITFSDMNPRNFNVYEPILMGVTTLCLVVDVLYFSRLFDSFTSPRGERLPGSVSSLVCTFVACVRARVVDSTSGVYRRTVGRNLRPVFNIRA